MIYKKLDATCPDEQANWFIFYTCPRAEKVVYENMLSLGYEVFLPMEKMLRVWKNRQRKFIDRPIFPSYIFIRTKKSHLYDIAKIPKICYFLTINGKPAIISHSEIESIKRITLSNKEIIVDTNIQIGEKIIIMDGELSGCEGILLLYKGKKKFGVRLVGTNYVVFVDIEKNTIKRI